MAENEPVLDGFLSLSLTDLLPDPPEVSIEKLCNLFPILKSKSIFLESKLKAINEEETEGGKRSAQVQLLQYLSTCGMHLLEIQLLDQIISAQHLLNITIMPPSINDSAVMQSTHRKILEQLDGDFKLSLNISEYLKSKAAIEKEIRQVETEVFATAEKLEAQLQNHAKEKEELKSKHTELSTEKIITSRLKKINFMRTVMSTLINCSKRNLLKEPELAGKLVKYGTPLTIREIKEM